MDHYPVPAFMPKGRKGHLPREAYHRTSVSSIHGSFRQIHLTFSTLGGAVGALIGVDFLAMSRLISALMCALISGMVGSEPFSVSFPKRAIRRTLFHSIIRPHLVFSSSQRSAAVAQVTIRAPVAAVQDHGRTGNDFRMAASWNGRRHVGCQGHV
jgi:hypothetical protein